MQKFDEIGSEYWKADTCTEFNNEINNAYFTASGRSAQSLILECAEIENKNALLPAYTCQHIVEPFAWNGWNVDFYDINRDLTINLESLKNKINKNPGCILLHGYYGFPTAKSANFLFKAAQRQGAVIIEDITHGFLSGWCPGYKEADYLFCSLRKWSGLPDGGYATALKRKKLYQPEMEMRSFASSRAAARSIKNKYVKSLDTKEKDEYLRLYAEAEALLDGDIGVYAMSNSSREDFRNLDLSFIADKRRKNFEYLLKNIKSEYVKPIFNELSEDVCPIMFPVYIDKHRTELRQVLIENRIYCPVHWPAPVQLTQEASKSSEEIYNRIMSIPCDQRYGIDDMRRLVDVINDFHI